ncbi:YhgE/Pip domain-containing protein [Fodinicola acaciae]|uniref:YhgE/Pip domain-containing protein n=1 Tax=Fodinicola acaciae TaxID=2681555 RepID=UPI0013D0EF44|nr:YhgE/Pip domain-containing protein [Fodinicola acaciae]
MRTLRLAGTELRRFTTGKMPKLAMVAVLLLPLLYGALYLYAFWDPYGRLPNAPAALVVADKGTTVDGRHTNAGQDLAKRLTASKSAFGWQVTTAADASKGVADGSYYLSLTIPANFSEQLASPAGDDPQQAQLQVTTNDANNYLAGTIGKAVFSEVRTAVAAQAGAKYADTMLIGFTQLHASTLQAASGSNQLAGGADQLTAGLGTLASGAGQLSSGTGQLSSGLDQLDTSTADLPSATQKLAAGSAKVAAGDKQIAAIGDQANTALGNAVSTLKTDRSSVVQRLRQDGLTDAQITEIMASYDKATGRLSSASTVVSGKAAQLDQLSAGAAQVAAGNAKLAAAAPALHNGIHKAATGAAQLDSGAGQLSSGLQQAHTGASKLATGAHTLSSKLSGGADQIPHPDAATRNQQAGTMGDPVAVHTVADNKVPNYGTGFAPYFLPLALWVGAVVLYMLLRPLSERALAARTPAFSTALAGWLPAAAIGALQGLLLIAVVVFGLGLQVGNPLGMVAFLVLTALVFTALVQMFLATFGTPGRLLGLVALMVQLVSAGGTYPWQTTPPVLRFLHPLLPMSYVVDALRHLIAGDGGGTIVRDALVLLAFGVGALAITTYAAYRKRTWSLSRLHPEIAI